MARLALPTTKANLLRLKEDLELAQEGRQLLDEKREIILRELFSHLEDLRRSRAEAESALAAAYTELSDACLALGREQVARAGLAAPPPAEITAQERSLFGVVLPLLSWEPDGGAPPWGLLGTSLELDLARERFLAAMRRLVEQAELEIAFRRLAVELRKTQKRVNALQNLLIPQYQQTVSYMESGLEEREREALFQLKRVQSRREVPE
jgi:V/A-type H+-transporting ATPase subunit D